MTNEFSFFPSVSGKLSSTFLTEQFLKTNDTIERREFLSASIWETTNQTL